LSVATPSIPRDEYRTRRKRAVEAAREAGLDGLLVWSVGGSRLDSFGDVFYLTNHYATESKTYNLRPHWTGFGHAAVVLPVDGEPVLLVHKPDWRDDLVVVDDVRVCADLYARVADCLEEKGLSEGRLGLVREEYVPLPFHRELSTRFPRLRTEPADEVLERMRVVKSPAEIEMMRHASAVSVEVMNAMLEAVAVGRTDGDLAAIGFHVATSLGGTPWDFGMASGPQSDHMWWSRLPAFDTRRPYAAGDLVHPDVYGCVNGYFYDFVRSTVVGGEPNAKQLELMEGSLAVAEFVSASLRPGVRCRDVHAAGLRFAAEHGIGSVDEDGAVGRATLPFFGHGIGLGFEGPWLTYDHDTMLEPGMTVAVEICLTADGIGAAHEDTVLVTEGEAEVMTAACKPRWWSSA
jgi:Xaa-Pro aminopeptidase